MSRYQRSVRIWHIPLDPGPQLVARCLDLLAGAERGHVSRFASPELARRYTVAAVAARPGAGRPYFLPAEGDAGPCRLADVATEPGYLAAVAMLGVGPYEVHHRRWPE